MTPWGGVGRITNGDGPLQQTTHPCYYAVSFALSPASERPEDEHGARERSRGRYQNRAASEQGRAARCNRYLRGRRRLAGVSAALEAARLGRQVALVDGLPTLGGQMVNSIIGTFCGLFANGTHGHQFTYGIADDILRDLGKIPQALYRRHGPVTTVVYYDEVALGRWVEEAVRKAGITVILGAVLRGVKLEGRRVKRARNRDPLRRHQAVARPASSTRPATRR